MPESENTPDTSKDELDELLEHVIAFQKTCSVFGQTVKTSQALARDAITFLRAADEFREEMGNALANGMMEITPEKEKKIKRECDDDAAKTVQAVLTWILDTTPDAELRDKLERLHSVLIEYSLLTEPPQKGRRIEFPEETIKHLLCSG